MRLKLLAFAVLSSLFLLGWSVPEAQVQSNATSIVVEDFCSGTVISRSKGLVITAAHCLGPVRSVTKTVKETPEGLKVIFVTTHKPLTLTLYKYDQYGNSLGFVKYPSIVLKYDDVLDYAVLKITGSELPSDAVKISYEKPAYGDKVYAIGTPLGFDQSVSEGRVTKPRAIVGFTGKDIVVVMHNAYINYGSSGGGLFNDKGELIGLTNFGKAGGPYFAVPMYALESILKEIL